MFSWRLQREAARFEERFWSGINLADLRQQLGTDAKPGLPRIFAETFDELAQARKSGLPPEATARLVDLRAEIELSRLPPKLQARFRPFTLELRRILTRAIWS